MALSRYQQAASGFLPLSSPRGRAKTPELESKEAIRPVARPTDPYTAVTRTAKSPLWELAGALSEFESSLSGFVRKNEADTRAQEEARGEAEFVMNNETNYADAVRDGRIPSYASPHFQEGYRAAQGRALARTIGAEALSQYEQWAATDDTDSPAAFSQWIGGRVRERLSGVQDPIVLQHAMPGIRQMTSRLGQQHAGVVSERLMNRAVNGLSADVGGAVDTALAEPVVGADGRTRDYGALRSEIEILATAGHNTGIPRERAEKAIIDSVIARAVQARDPDLLGAIPDNLRNGAYGTKHVAEALEKIHNRQWQDDSRSETVTNREEKAAREAATRDAIGVLLRDPNAPIPDEILQRGEQGQADFRVRVEEIRQRLRRQDVRVDPARETAASVRIHTAADPFAQAIREIEGGNIADPARVNSILYTANRLRQSRGRGQDSILNLDTTRNMERAFEQHFTTPANPLMAGSAASTDRIAYGNTLTNYQIALSEWEEKNPNATIVERMKASREIGEEMMRGLSTGRPQPNAPRSSTSNTPTPQPNNSNQPAAPTPQNSPTIPPELLQQLFPPRQQPQGGTNGNTPPSPQAPATPAPPTLQGPAPQVVPDRRSEAPDASPRAVADSATRPTTHPVTGRPIINNPDGSISTEETITVGFDDKFYNIPTIVNGQRVSSDEAIRLFRAGQNKETGIFNSKQEAENAARARTDMLGRTSATEPTQQDRDLASSFVTAALSEVDRSTSTTGRANVQATVEFVASTGKGGAVSPDDVARKFLGQTEGRNAQALAAFFRRTTGNNLNPRTTAWCAAFANAVLAESGRAGTGSNLARSFLRVGTPTEAPSEGDIVVLRRGGSSWQGHVGFFAGRNPDGTINVLGGNQGRDGRVSIARFPENKVLGYRVPPPVDGLSNAMGLIGTALPPTDEDGEEAAAPAGASVGHEGRFLTERESTNVEDRRTWTEGQHNIEWWKQMIKSIPETTARLFGIGVPNPDEQTIAPGPRMPTGEEE